LSMHATQVWPSRSSFVGRARSRRYVGHMGIQRLDSYSHAPGRASSPDPANKSMPVRDPAY
jgi:hypothetical protein